MPTELQVEWGQRLREVREERGLTGGELAKAAGVTRQHIQRVEVGITSSSDAVRIKIAAALGVQVTDIWSYPEAP